MTDKITREQRSANMRAVRNRDTKPELIVRRVAHGLGYRFRLHPRGLPGRPDITFPGRHKVIFVHGCFWHHHNGCRRGTMPRSNVRFWRSKLAGNVRRDAEQLKKLRATGWRVLVVWECETGNDGPLRSRLRRFLK